MDRENFSQLFERILLNEKVRNLTKVKQEMLEALAQERQEQAAFEARLYQRWKTALDLFETVLLLGQQSGTKFNQEVRPYAAKQQDFVFEVLTRLQARACQTMSAILSLLKSGHAM